MMKLQYCRNYQSIFSGFFKSLIITWTRTRISRPKLKLLILVWHKFSGTWTLKYPKIGYPYRVYSCFKYLMTTLNRTKRLNGHCWSVIVHMNECPTWNSNLERPLVGKHVNLGWECSDYTSWSFSSLLRWKANGKRRLLLSAFEGRIFPVLYRVGF